MGEPKTEHPIPFRDLLLGMARSVTVDQRLRKRTSPLVISETYAAAGRSVVGSGEKEKG